MFAKHDEDIWYYDEVHPNALQNVNIIGFAFENVEVFSMDHDVIEEIVMENYKESFIYRHEEDDAIKKPFKMASVDFFRLELRKDKLEDTSHVCLDGMFSGTDEENIESLAQHFSIPDLVAITLFDTDRKEMVDFYIPWEGDSEYVNDAVIVEEKSKHISIKAMSKEFLEKHQKA